MNVWLRRDQEMRQLEAACKRLDPGPDYGCNDYIENVLLTVPDFQMKVKTVGNALDYFKKTPRH